MEVLKFASHVHGHRFEVRVRRKGRSSILCVHQIEAIGTTDGLGSRGTADAREDTALRVQSMSPVQSQPPLEIVRPTASIV